MECVGFKEANITLKGDHITDHYGQRVRNIKAFRDDDEMITKWRMSFRERLSALLFGTVWLRVLGKVPPPVALSVKKNIF